ncbi:MAG: hypothetical protein QXG22_03210 [Candidatus Hadarchaeales archaeon]
MPPTEEDLINWGTEIGTLALSEKIEKNQLERLIASLESVGDPRLALYVTAVFALRQSHRKERGKALLTEEFAKRVASILHQIYKANGSRTEARKMLVFAKWILEASTEEQTEEQIRSTLKEFASSVFRDVDARL